MRTNLCSFQICSFIDTWVSAGITKQGYPEATGSKIRSPAAPHMKNVRGGRQDHSISSQEGFRFFNDSIHSNAVLLQQYWIGTGFAELIAYSYASHLS